MPIDLNIETTTDSGDYWALILDVNVTLCKTQATCLNIRMEKNQLCNRPETFMC